MFIFLKFILFFYNFVLMLCDGDTNDLPDDGLTTKTFMFWPNATVPFYINPDHFDHEQALVIMTALSMFAFKTCLKFVPVMAAPEGDQHIMAFENPEGIRRCKIITSGHSIYGPHSVILGYECLQPPQIEMIIMKALGFPFEHNRASRDVFIEVLVENIEPGSMELFTKDSVLPVELRLLPYDVNSVMHFGERDFSKNGHRTIIFRDHNIQQNRKGLSPIDLRKIEIIYGPQCLKRDRQEKIELCQSYPGVARRKRDVTAGLKSLRVNPDITPPPDTSNATITDDLPTEAQEKIKELGIEEEVQVIVEHAYKVSALALKNARVAYCNVTNYSKDTEDKNKNATDLLQVIEVIADYAKSVVDNALSNLTVFCEASDDLQKYQRQRACSWGDNSDRCRQTYRSTKSGPVRYSTQHRPTYIQSTKHDGYGKKFQGRRAEESLDNATDITTESVRSKRELNENANTTDDVEINTEMARMEPGEMNKLIITHDVKWEDSGDVEIPSAKVAKTEVVTGKETASLDTMTASVNIVSEMTVEDSTKNNINSEVKKPEVTVLSANTTVQEPTVVSESPKAHNRRKRDVISDKKPDIVVQNTNATVQDPVEVTKLTNSTQEVGVMTTKSGFMKVKFGEQRFFQGRRFRVKNPKGKDAKVDWDASAVSMENTHNKKQHRHKNIEEQEIKEKEVENAKKKEERLVSKDQQRTEKKRRVRNMVPKTVTLTKLNAEFYNERKWPGGDVRYVLAENPLYDLNDVRHRLGVVSALLKRRTCVNLYEVTEDEANNYIDYLVIDTSPDYVTGRVGGKQNFGSVELFRGGQHRQHAAMMVMAMLGFYFEVARHDRDKYIRVHMRHVRPDKLHHFEKIREEATLNVPYDYQSAMHPAWQFWRKIGKTGISTVATYKEHDPDGSVMKSLGQNEELLSELDIVKINSVYGVKCFQNMRSKTKNAEGKRK